MTFPVGFFYFFGLGSVNSQERIGKYSFLVLEHNIIYDLESRSKVRQIKNQSQGAGPRINCLELIISCIFLHTGMT
jgi:hypothetical protein